MTEPSTTEANVTKLVNGGAHGEYTVVWSRLLKSLPAIATAAVIAILGQGFLMWREQAVTNKTLKDNGESILALQREFAAHVHEAENRYVRRDEWIDAKAQERQALTDGLEGINRTLGYIVDRTQHNQAILEKLPVQEKKR